MHATVTRVRIRNLLLPGILLLALTAHGNGSEPAPNTFYPKGETMLFSMYSLVAPQLNSSKADGLTAIGPYYGKRDLEKELAYARAAKLPILYTAGRRLDFDADTNIDIEAELEILQRAIATASKHPEIAAWALANEELRYWRPAEMDWLQRATKIIRDNDPYNRPVMMYEPNNRSADALIKTSQYLDIVAKGSYANYAGMKYKRTWIRWSIEQTVAAAAATATTPLAILWMAKDQENDSDIASIRQWTRHDVYLSLITGAKGIIVFSGWNGRAGFQQHFQNFYDGYTSAAKELNGDLNLSRIFLRGDKTDSVSVSVIDGPATQTFEFQKETHTYPTIASAEFLLNGKHYLFVVNSAESRVAITLEGLPQNKSIFDAFSGNKVDHAQTIDLNRLDVIALTW